mmetsp:Transcript_22744/g.52828  ORF Transcript_22744/g.52828 Transcript_22744/m.52828 type:complete len:228 (+) Transcript_22744:1094-1777(+)
MHHGRGGGLHVHLGGGALAGSNRRLIVEKAAHGMGSRRRRHSKLWRPLRRVVVSCTSLVENGMLLLGRKTLLRGKVALHLLAGGTTGLAKLGGLADGGCLLLRHHPGLLRLCRQPLLLDKVAVDVAVGSLGGEAVLGSGGSQGLRLGALGAAAEFPLVGRQRPLAEVELVGGGDSDGAAVEALNLHHGLAPKALGHQELRWGGYTVQASGQGCQSANPEQHHPGGPK